MNEPRPGRAIPRREALRITAAAGIGAALGYGILDLVRTGRLHRVDRTRVRMGSPVTLTAVHPDPQGAREWVEAAFAEMERLEGILSRYRPESALSRLNSAGRLEGVPTELRDVVLGALEVAESSGGAFDPTVAPLLALHQASFARGGSSGEGGPPSPSEVAATLERVGYRHLRVEGDGISFARPGMTLTLDGIAKGHIVDRSVRLLAELGAERVLVNAGGDLGAAGSPAPGDPWRVGIQDPDGHPGGRGVLGLGPRGGAATSGDYIHAFTPDRTHHHILDPRTGWSPAHTRSVTVLAPSCLEADALATAALVLGPGEGTAFLDARPGVEGLLLARDGTEHATRGFRRHLI